ncbi:MAG: TIGR03960 family B12-binding radical SAM protein [Chitinispirillales bacterium]|jgi:radical SAM family uncharacterized protein/radical SAM-linked protein|nr:TIGR03960 family B12-binding radical SAM protein [Chitinispirillales bacterium]
MTERIQKEFLPNVSKPLRYTGSELNVIRKNLDEVTVHGCCCFPDLYDIGMSHHGLQILYHIVNSNPKWALSRCFAPWSDAERIMREADLPLFTLEYYTPVKAAHWIGFSVQYELQYSNLVNMLDLAGLPVLSSQRGEEDPVVIAGGPCMTNPEPIANFVDASLIGDGEEAVWRFCEVIEKYKGEGRSKILAEVAKISGFYVPSKYTLSGKGRFVVPEIEKDVPVIKPARISAFDAKYLPRAPLVPLMDVVHHRLAIEVMRGCTRGCRFCSAGMYYRPVREKEIAHIKEQTEQGVLCTGWRDVGLLSLSTADYSRFTPLLDSMNAIKANHRLKMSIPSTRIDALSDEQLDALNSVCPVTSFTIAPEAASARLRKVINKDFSDEAVFQTVELLLSRNLTTLKLYFMLGLPTESEEDIQAIIDMVKNIASMMRRRSPRLALHVSLSPFSPKANTPFQWEAMESVESVEEKGRFVKRCLRDKKNVKVSYRNGSVTFLETVMARGDRRAGDLIYEAWRAGARFDGWDEFFNINLWRTAAERLGMDLSVYTTNIDTNENLPWSAVSVGVDKEFLLKERLLAMQEKPTPDCKGGPCSKCGACGKSVSITLCKEPEPVLTQNSSAVNYGRRKHNVSENRHSLHYRFIYEKRDTVRFLGHLDMVEVIRRAMTAADFPLVYSQGFNPHPKVSFGPPLPFGAVGLAEAFDIETDAPLEGGPLELNRWLPGGLEVKLCIKNERPLVSLNSSITACRYKIYPPVGKFTKDEMYNMLAAFKERTEIIVEREKKGVVSKRDIRGAVKAASVCEDERSAHWDAVLSLSPKASCKPSEFISSLCPNENINNYYICRAEFLYL